MKNIALAVIMAAITVFSCTSCKKSSADTESALSIETNPANKSNSLNILGPDFPLRVAITSKMPGSGVKIEVTASAEGNSTSFYTATNNSTAPQNDYAITNTPSGTTCIVNITVTSLSKISNSWQGTYRYSKK